jgi:hypothetical protein
MAASNAVRQISEIFRYVIKISRKINQFISILNKGEKGHFARECSTGGGGGNGGGFRRFGGGDRGGRDGGRSFGNRDGGRDRRRSRSRSQ